MIQNYINWEKNK